MPYQSNRKTGPLGPSGYSPGFTLVELVLATAISGLVIAIMSVCLSFSLRAWESMQNRKPDQSALLVDLLKLQLAELDPTPVQSGDGDARPFFRGDNKTLAFATSHSVRAISHGVPVVVRYAYDPKSQVLFYSEIPFDPYHGKTIREFLDIKSVAESKQKIRFFKIDIAGFGLSYLDDENKPVQQAWEREDKFPVAVVLNWNTPDSGAFSRLVTVNSPFAIQNQQEAAAAQGVRLRGNVQ